VRHSLPSSSLRVFPMNRNFSLVLNVHKIVDDDYNFVSECFTINHFVFTNARNRSRTERDESRSESLNPDREMSRSRMKKKTAD